MNLVSRTGWAAFIWFGLVAQLVNNLPAMWETWVPSLGWEDPWKKGQLPTPVFWPGEFCRLYGPWVAKSQTQLSDFHFHFATGRTIAVFICFYFTIYFKKGHGLTIESQHGQHIGLAKKFIGIFCKMSWKSLNKLFDQPKWFIRKDSLICRYYQPVWLLSGNI